MTSLTHLWIEVPLLSDALDKLPDVLKLYPASPPEHRLSNAKPAQAVLASSGIQYDDRTFDQLPNLRILVRTGIGIDNVNLDAATERGIVICNTPDGPTESTAEHAVALLLALAKRVKQGDANMAEGSFGPRSLLIGTELYGKTLGLVGLGRIGRRVAQICHEGLGMNVLACDPYIPAEIGADLGVSMADLPEVIAQADFLSLHAPSTPETYHMIDADAIDSMKDGAYLINVARGPLVDQDALVDAVNRGKLTGAGLDVFDPEPPAGDSGIRNHPNIVVTPHSASLTTAGRARIEHMAVDSIISFFDGNQPQDICNPAVWTKTV